jgi:hypothetical protein
MKNRDAKRVRRIYRDFRAGRVPAQGDAAFLRELLESGEDVERVVNRAHATMGAGPMVRAVPWGEK